MSEIRLRDLSAFINENVTSVDGPLGTLIAGFERWDDEGDVFFTSRDLGIEIKANTDGEVSAVFLFADGVDDSKQYKGEIPGGLSFGLCRREARHLLGEPVQQAGAGQFLGRQILPWDKFDLPEFVLHITYALDEMSIQKFSLLRR